MTPLLILTLGVAPIVAIATDLVFAFITKIVGTIQHHMQRTIHKKAAVYLAIGGIIGSLASSFIVTFAGNTFQTETVEYFLKLFLGLVLIIVSSILFLENFEIKIRNSIIQKKIQRIHNKKPWALLMGLIIGVIVGVSSAGSGVLVTLGLVLFTNMSMKKIVGTNLVVAMAMVGSAAIAHMFARNVSFSLLGLLLIGSIPGVLIGSRFANRVPEQNLRFLLTILIFISGAAMILKAV